MKGPIEVEIFGQTFTLTSEDTEVYVREVAAYVDQQMQQIAHTTKTVATLRVAILAALNIADQYHKTRQRKEEICREVETLSASLLGKLSQIETTSSAPESRGRREVAAARPEPKGVPPSP